MFIADDTMEEEEDFMVVKMTVWTVAKHRLSTFVNNNAAALTTAASLRANESVEPQQSIVVLAM